MNIGEVKRNFLYYNNISYFDTINIMIGSVALIKVCNVIDFQQFVITERLLQKNILTSLKLYNNTLPNHRYLSSG